MTKNTLRFAAVAVAASLLVTACTPPHQKDSDKKVETATSGVQKPASTATSSAHGSASETASSEAEATESNEASESVEPSESAPAGASTSAVPSVSGSATVIPLPAQ